jgi:hypothetical protein
VDYRDEEDPGHDEAAQATPRERGRPSRTSPLLVLLAALILALLAVAAVLLWRSLGDSISGTSVAKDSLDSAGQEPHVRLTNAAGQVRVEGVEGSNTVEYEATRYAAGSDPEAAKQQASEVHVDITREDSRITIKTEGGGDTGADYALRIPAGASVEAPKGDVTVANVNTDTGGAELEVGAGDVALEDLILGTLEAGVEAGSVTFSGRFSGDGRVSVETGDIIARLPAEDTRDLTLQTRVGNVLREPPEGNPKGNDPEKQQRQ